MLRQPTALQPKGDIRPKVKNPLRGMGEATGRNPDSHPGSSPYNQGLQPKTGVTTLARHISPHNQTSVPVLDKDGIPVAPTRPSRARRLLDQGRAAKTWKHGRFAIRLSDISKADCSVPDVTLGIDPGARTTGMAVTVTTPDGEKIVHGCQVRHRGHRISQAMLSRRSYRRNRRSRIRRRPARFNNRTRRQGWLPPSLESIRANIRTNVSHLTELFPVSVINVETCRFDPRLIADPDVYGDGYQTSERANMQVREYVLQRDRRTCQYCGKTGVRLEADHIVPRSRGGAYRIANLIAACHDCNQAKSNLPVEHFLKDRPETLRKLRQQMRSSLQSAAHMNALVPFVITDVESLGIPVRETDAVNTAFTRTQLGIEKSHVNDAACLGEPPALLNVPTSITVISATGHGKRQMLTQMSKHGTPRFQTGAAGKYHGYRAWSRLPRQRQGFTTMPGHKLRQRRSHGIASGDLIAYRHPTDGKVTGYAVLANRKTRARASGMKSVRVTETRLIARNNGYQYQKQTNSNQEN